jgi:hypothetical protein
MNETAARLNGYRAPLIINAVTLVPIAAVLISTWSDVQQLKSDRAERVSPERLAKIEATLAMGTTDRYHASDAKRDFDWRDYEIKELQQRVRDLEAHRK